MPSSRRDIQALKQTTGSLAAPGLVHQAGRAALAVGASIFAHVVPKVFLAQIVESLGVAEVSRRRRVVEIMQQIQSQIFVLRNADTGKIRVTGLEKNQPIMR